MSEKDPGAFRTIGEVAEELDLPQHVLRFWETKFSQIRPTKRSSGRRFYRPEDVALVRTIRDLLYREGYTIRGVQQLLRERGARKPAGTAAEPASDREMPQAPNDAARAQTPEAGIGGEGAMACLTGSAIADELRDCVAVLQQARGAR